MADGRAEVIDSQIIAENVGFLDNCFENSFDLQSSLIAIKEYVSEEQIQPSSSKLREGLANKKVFNVTQNKTIFLDATSACDSQRVLQVVDEQAIISNNLKDWGLPDEIARKYEERGIATMFDWQVSCLRNAKVLRDCCNLVYSAPTSAGKTLVAEILTIKTLLERQKKVIFILPFVSIVREKMFYLQSILSSSGIRVEGFMGSKSPPGGLQSVHVAICTIEKANSLVNRLLDEGNISELGAVIVDELHLLGDPHRGYILELLLTKIKFVSSKIDDVHIQIVGMSATLPNLEILATWLDAELFITQFRPIPLDEFCLVGNKLYNKNGQVVNTLKDTKLSADDGDNVLKICFDTIKDNCSVLIFCMTKARCENLAQSIATSFYKLGCSGTEMGSTLRAQLKPESISEILEQLQNCPVGLDQVVKKTVAFGVAYHHAGLTFDERDIIEGAFKSGAIRVLVATSTLSSGVNLPARKVIIRTPVFQRQPINILTYKQMIGRAGRMGKDTKGESILICTQAEKKIGFNLMMGTLDPVKSCIESEDKYMRAVLEMIASQVACTKTELDLYSKCTLLFTQQNISPSQNNLLTSTLKELKNFELIREQIDEDEIKYVATPLGKACLSSSMAPNDGLSLFCELQKARQCLVLETDLHLIYLVTPYSVSSQWGDIDWLHLLTLWETLTKAMKRVGELVGVQESFIIRCMRGTNKNNNAQNKLNIHKRFYTALALQDLVNEVPLSEVATKFQCARGFLQSLQQAAATFAGMVTAFSRQLGWKNMEMLIAQFQDRLHFGIHSELIELMKLPSLNGLRARSLFDAGFETISTIASADVIMIENALHKAVPFQSEKERDGDDCDDIRRRNKIKSIWITGYCGITIREAAENLISEARKYLQLEIGVTEIKWGKKANENSNESVSICNDSNIASVDSKVSNMTMNEVQQEIRLESSDTKTAIPIVMSIVNNDQATPKIKEESSLFTEIVTKSNAPITEFTVTDTEYFFLSANVCKTNVDDVMVQDNLVKDVFDETQTLSSMIDNAKTVDAKGIVTAIDSPIIEDFKSPIEKFSSPVITSFVKTGKSISKMKTEPLRNITNNTQTHCSPSILDDGIIWDSMNFTEGALVNITKARTSDQFFSPNVSFGDIEEKFVTKTEITKSTVKDISLFSSEGDNSSLFEESFPLEMPPNKTENYAQNYVKESIVSKLVKQETVADFISINSESMLKAFKTTIVEDDPDDDEDIKLVYEGDTDYKLSENELETGFNLSQAIEETQIEVQTTVNSSFRSPFKRQATDSRNTQPTAKKARLNKNPKPISTLLKNEKMNIKMNSSKSKKFTIKICQHKMKCYLLKDQDIIHNVSELEKIHEASLFMDLRKCPQRPMKLIGSNIFNQNGCASTSNDTDANHGSIERLTIYNGNVETCISLDLTSLGNNIKDIPERLSSWVIKTTKLKTYCLKSDYVNFKKCFNIDLPKTCEDISLGKWLIDSDEKIPSMMELTKKYCNIDLLTVPIKVDRSTKKHHTLNNVEKSCVRAWCIWEVASGQATTLLEQQQIMDIELHIARILGACERRGINVDKTLASQLLVDVQKSMEALQQEASNMCGYQINLHCSKDIAKALGMYRAARKVSTKKSVLTSHTHPMSSVVIYWRKLRCILTNTLYPLTMKSQYSEGDRIHPSYTMFTATGRISMHEPNLQSMPRTFAIPCRYLGLGSDDVIEYNCRNIFVATSGFTLVSADYCQLEMRILTHYSEDEVLTAIMRSDEDVFKSIAASWGDVPEVQVDDDLRQKAKGLCYGILYGMGNKSLAQSLDVTEADACVFMTTFYKTYPKIQVFTQRVIEQCRQNGYVETLMKRRRYLPEITSGIVAKKNAAERKAVNTTIQGSAADIAKAAMCAVDNQTNTHTDPPRLLLQMHDELIYEVPVESKESFARLLKNVMEETVRLNVPLPVKVRSGLTWGTLKEVHIAT